MVASCKNRDAGILNHRPTQALLLLAEILSICFWEAFIFHRLHSGSEFLYYKSWSFPKKPIHLNLAGFLFKVISLDCGTKVPVCAILKKNPLCKSHFDLRIWVFAMYAGFPSPTEGCETLWKDSNMSPWVNEAHDDSDAEVTCGEYPELFCC